MLQGIDLNQVRQYNTSLKQYKDKASSLKAEIDYTNKEIDTLCTELSAELGINVTRDNIQQVYEDQVSKINSTLQSGNAVLAKIASEEQTAAQTQTVQTVQAQAAQTPVQSVPTPPEAPTVGVALTGGIAPTVESNPVAGSVFGTAQSAPLPPMFSI